MEAARLGSSLWRQQGSEVLLNKLHAAVVSSEHKPASCIRHTASCLETHLYAGLDLGWSGLAPTQCAP